MRRLIATSWIPSATLGAVITVGLGHPLLEWIHLWRSGDTTDLSVMQMLISSIAKSLSADMLPMTAALAGFGAIVGCASAWIYARRGSNSGKPSPSERVFDDLRSLISEGEHESLEFKSSLRWDRKLGKVNKHLEAVIAKTLCGMMNHKGGMLLIGVDDDGQILGIEKDWEMLKHSNRDGFEQRIVALVTSYLGGQNTGAVRSEFHCVEEKTIAVVRIKPTHEPVFCKDGNLQRYYLRAGNTTRELDTQEALAHIKERDKT
jgi:hypothetical protein